MTDFTPLTVVMRWLHLTSMAVLVGGMVFGRMVMSRSLEGISPESRESIGERAALAWTEAVTLVTNGHVPDEVYAEARKQFDEKEISDLTFAVAAINAWNRLAIASRTVPGTYQPAKTHSVEKSA